jgi:hypothetical protein
LPFSPLQEESLLLSRAITVITAPTMHIITHAKSNTIQRRKPRKSAGLLPWHEKAQYFV